MGITGISNKHQNASHRYDNANKDMFNAENVDETLSPP